MTRLIFVTGGVVSSVGKGVSVASLARILKSRGVSVSVLKLDPYLNVDPGTMSPYQRGASFVANGGRLSLRSGQWAVGCTHPAPTTPHLCVPLSDAAASTPLTYRSYHAK